MSVQPFGYHRGGSFVRRSSQSTPLMVADGWAPLYESDPGLSIEQLLHEIHRLEKLVYVPGVLRCPKCKFSQVSATLHVNTGGVSANNEPAPCPNGCGPLWRHTERDAGNELADRVDALAEKAAKYNAINTPEVLDFIKAVELEALHQRERWGSDHDSGKADADWFWLIGYLAGKALAATKGQTLPRYRHVKNGGTYEILSIGEDENRRGVSLVVYRGEDDGKIWVRPSEQFFDGRFEELTPKPREKVLHHIITTAAACLNWHAHALGTYQQMRPGIAPPDGHE